MIDELSLQRDKRTNKDFFAAVDEKLTNEEKEELIDYVDIGETKKKAIFNMVKFVEKHLGGFEQFKKTETNIGYLYLMECKGFYKIGISKNANERLNSINISIPFKVRMIANVKIHNPRKAEKYWHDYYKNYRVSGEWFNFSKSEARDIAMFMASEGGFFEDGLLFDYEKIYMDSEKMKLAISIVNDSCNLTKKEERLIRKLQNIDASLIKLGTEYQERKAKLTKHYQEKMCLPE